MRLPPGAEGMAETALAVKAAITSDVEGNCSTTVAVKLAFSIRPRLPLNLSRLGPKKVQLGSETGSSAADVSGEATSTGVSCAGSCGFASMYPAAVMNRPAPHAATILNIAILLSRLPPVYTQL